MKLKMLSSLMALVLIYKAFIIITSNAFCAYCRWKSTQFSTITSGTRKSSGIFDLLSCDDECRITRAPVSGDQYDTTRTVSLGASDARVE